VFWWHFFILDVSEISQLWKYDIISVLLLNSKRVVFNIKGNDYRLIVDIEFKLKIVFIVWFGTPSEYEKIDARLISYEN